MINIFHKKIVLIILILQFIIISASTMVEVTYAASTITVPTFITGYPQISNVTNNGFDFNVQTNTPTTIYSMLCKVYKDSGDAYNIPAKSYVRLVATSASDDFNNSCKKLFGMLDCNTMVINSTGADIITSFNASLVTNTTYAVYSILKYYDQNGKDAYTSVISKTFKMPPSFSSGFPKYTVSGSGNNAQVNIQAQIDQAGDYNVYYVILKNSTSSPTSQQFNQWILGTSATDINIISKNKILLNQNGNTYGNISVNLNGLQSSDSYDIYVTTYVVDSSGNGNNIIRVPVKASIPPGFTIDGTPSGQLTDLTSGCITLKVDKASNIYCIDSTKQFTSDEIAALDIKTLAKQISNNQKANVNSIDSGVVANNVTENAYYQIAINNLTANLDHYVYMILESSKGNGESSSILGPYTLQDVVPPSFTSSNYPQTSNILSTSVDIVVSANKVCTAYYLAIPANSDTAVVDKSINTLINGSASYSTITGASSGSFAISNVNSQVSKTITGLLPSINYNVYVVLVDSKGNKMAKAATTQVTTSNAAIPGLTNDGIPSGQLTDLTRGFITLKLDKSSNIYCIDSTRKFTTDEINALDVKNLVQKITNKQSIDTYNSIDFGISTMSVTSCRINLTALTSNSDHYIYMMLENANVAGIGTGVLGPYKLADLIIPSINSTYPQITNNSTGTSFDLAVKTNKKCTAYYLLVPADSTGKDNYTAYETINNLTNDNADYSSISGAVNGKFDISKADADSSTQITTTTINGLTSNTAYNIYVALKDWNGNLSSVVSNLSKKTVDIKAPSIVSTPSASMSTLTSGSITLKVDKPTYTNIYCIEYSIDPTKQFNTYDSIIKGIQGNDITAFKNLAANSTNSIIGSTTNPISIGTVSISDGSIDFATKIPSDSINSSGFCTINISGLTSNVDHYIYFILENANTNGLSSSVLGCYKLNDLIAPSFIISTIAANNYPQITNNSTGTSLDLAVKTNKRCTAYYLVVPADSTGKDKYSTYETTKYITTDGADYSSISGAVNGKFDISKTDADSSTQVTPTTINGLTSNTAYNIYVALKDWNGNISSTVSTLSKKTLDIKAPSIVSTPSASMSTLTSGAITLKVDKPTYTNIYCIEYSIDPTKQFSTYDGIIKGIQGNDIVAFKNLAANPASTTNPISIGTASISEGSIDFATKISSNSISSSGSCTINMSGLTSNVDHYVYLILENANTNGLSSSVLGRYKLNDSIAPSLNSNYPQITNNSTGTSLDLAVKTNKRCTAYYLVVPADSTGKDKYSTYETTKYITTDGADYSGISGVVNGKFDISNSKVDADSTTINGLTSNTAYNIYVALKDWNGNISSTVSTLPKKTLDIKAPSIVSTPSGSMGSSANKNDLTSGAITLQVDKPTYTNIYCIEYSIDPSIQFSTYDSMIKGIQGNDITAFKKLAANFEKPIPASTTSPIPIGSVSISGGSIDFATKIPYNSNLISSSGSCTINMSGLTSNVDHYIYFILENANTNGASSSVLGCYKLNDSIAPSLNSNYPQIINDKGISFELAVKTNKRCTAYYLVVPTDSTRKDKYSTYETTKYLTDDNSSYKDTAGNNIGVCHGKFDISNSKADADSTTINGLTSNTAYNIYVALKDWNGSVSSTVSTILSKKTLDIKAPSIVSIPSGSMGSSANKSDLTSGSITIEVDRLSNIYCIEYSIDPTLQSSSTYSDSKYDKAIKESDTKEFKNLAANFKNPITASTTSPISIGSKSINNGIIEFAGCVKTSYLEISMSGLSPNVDHYVYFVLENAANTFKASTGVLGPYKLADAVAPSLTVKQATDNTANRGNALNLTVKAGKRCTAYYLAAPANGDGTDSYGEYETVASLTNDSTNYSSLSGAFHGTVQITKTDVANSTAVPTIIGNATSGWLNSNTAYNIYVALKDWNGNVSSSEPKIQVTTADVLPHVTGITASSITENSMNISVNVDKPCTLYYYVYPVPTSNDKAPNPGKRDIVNDNNTNIIQKKVESATTASPVTVDQTIDKDCNGNALIRNCKYYIYVCGIFGSLSDGKFNITPIANPTTGANAISSIIVNTQGSNTINRYCNESDVLSITDVGLCRYAMNTNKYVWKNFTTNNYGTATVRNIDDGNTLPNSVSASGTPKNSSNNNDDTKGYTINEKYTNIGVVYGNPGDSKNSGASVIWAGQIQPLYSGDHKFTLDIGGTGTAKMWIKQNGSYNEIIESSDGSTKSGKASGLNAGEKYFIIVHYASTSSSAKQCILTWTCPNSTTATPITSDRFFPVLDGTIFRQKDTSIHPTINNNADDLTYYYPILPHPTLKSGKQKDGTTNQFWEYDDTNATKTISIRLGILGSSIFRKANGSNTNELTDRYKKYNAKTLTAIASPSTATFSELECTTSDPRAVTIDFDGKTIRGATIPAVSETITPIYVYSADGVQATDGITKRAYSAKVIEPFTISSIKIIKQNNIPDSKIKNFGSMKVPNKLTVRMMKYDKDSYLGIQVLPKDYYYVGDYSDLSVPNPPEYMGFYSPDSTDKDGNSLSCTLGGVQTDSDGTYNILNLGTWHSYYSEGRYHRINATVTDYTGASKSDQLIVETSGFMF